MLFKNMSDRLRNWHKAEPGKAGGGQATGKVMVSKLSKGKEDHFVGDGKY